MPSASSLPLAQAEGESSPIELRPALANRHGLITGATGTGKTVTLQTMAEGFSRIGVPVFMADVKGDLSGLAAPGQNSAKFQQRLDALKITDWTPQAFPVVFWDVFGENGHPVRATISDMGPILLARLLNLNDTQAGVLQLAFKIADDRKLLLLDLKDLRAMIQYVGENAKQLTVEYGNVSAASIGAIQRNLLVLGEQGGDIFFGEPMLDINDLMQTDAAGRGVINILASEKLMLSSRLYSTFLLWLLSELFEQLPEIGDPEKPRLVFFFDEAHLLFSEAPPALLKKIEQVVRLIRSKGVGVYFVTQNPLDIPDAVLGQLGNRVQHALRAFTPRDQKAVQTAAGTMRPNPAFNAATVITELGVGEALVSFLDEKGRPNMVERATILPPASRIAPLSPAERSGVIRSSLLYGHYEAAIDRESAFEKLKAEQEARASTPAAASPPTRPVTPVSVPAQKPGDLLGGLGDLFGSGPASTSRRSGGNRQGVVETLAKSAARTIGSQVGRSILRGLLGSITGGRR
jgi:DNA helicase HerA-like ATPase